MGCVRRALTALLTCDMALITWMRPGKVTRGISLMVALSIEMVCMTGAKVVILHEWCKPCSGFWAARGHRGGVSDAVDLLDTLDALYLLDEVIEQADVADVDAEQAFEQSALGLDGDASEHAVVGLVDQ